MVLFVATFCDSTGFIPVSVSFGLMKVPRFCKRYRSPCLKKCSTPKLVARNLALPFCSTCLWKPSMEIPIQNVPHGFLAEIPDLVDDFFWPKSFQSMCLFPSIHPCTNSPDGQEQEGGGQVRSRRNFLGRSPFQHWGAHRKIFRFHETWSPFWMGRMMQ